MEALTSPEPGIPHAPIRLRITDDPRPAILLGPAGAEVDLTASLIRLEFVVDDVGARVLIDARADIAGVDFPVTHVFAAREVLDGLTATGLDDIIAGRGMSESPGQAVIEHLQERLDRGAH